jgi:AraC family transcriptional regulator
MKPRIQTIDNKKLVGIRLSTNLTNYQVGKLWKSFMPRRNEITGKLTDDLISMAIYKPEYFIDFKPTNEFEKWAAVEVSGFDRVPAEMETFDLPGGLYAVFDHKGLNTDHSIFQHILGTWLPGSEYELDYRPHFEVLGKKYRNNDPESEEEIWIPIKRK